MMKNKDKSFTNTLIFFLRWLSQTMAYVERDRGNKKTFVFVYHVEAGKTMIKKSCSAR